jgi:uncharacterized membrane protein YfcA
VSDAVLLIAAGFAAGAVAGLFGVGGGILFVPALALVAGLTQLEAQATSLLAIIPVSIVGAWRQERYGNLELRDGLMIGVLATAGGFAGVALSNVLPNRALEITFATLALVTAVQMIRRGIAQNHDDRERTWRP